MVFALLAFVPILVFFLLGKSKGDSQTLAGFRRPKLIVVIVIDQFREEYLWRFRPYFVDGGFNFLLSGASFTNCRYDYASTATCPGHATLFTGAYPNLHGIIANDWYDRELHRSVNCVEDGETKLVGGAEGEKGGGSPRRLVGSTIGDELRMMSGFASKVIDISLKDRGAIIPGGHTANAAYWYDPKSGHFVTSTYYMTALPAWVSQFNAAPPTKAYCGKPWQALPQTPGAAGRTFGELPIGPHELCPNPGFVAWLNNTPFMSEIELNFALEAVKSERLGQGAETDLLTISLSANDYLGHAFGPYSPQVADMTLRTDQYLADFFKELGRTMGLNNVWIVLSADHGIALEPRFIKEHHLGVGNVHREDISSAIEQALSEAFGKEKWIEGVSEFEIYLDQAALKKHDVNLGRAEFIAAEAAARVPGVRYAFPRAQLETGNLPDSPLAHKASNSFNNQRGGDIFLVFDAFAVPIEAQAGTTHASPWNYDALVPLLFWGSAFRPGVYASPCQTVDLAPTLAVALKLNQPSGAQGQPLTSVLR